MALVSIQEVSFQFDKHVLLDRVSLHLQRQERVCLLGRNGTGKTTFMKLVNKEIEPDSGNIRYAPGVRVSRIAQEVPVGWESSTVHSVIARGLGPRADEAEDDWKGEQAIDEITTRLQLDPRAEFSSLSGGLKRRTMMAQGLVSSPDVLLLDEPTNHLDIESTLWLEQFLLRSNLSIVFVTHDRMLTQKLATRIIELDRGIFHDNHCGYDTFLQRREARLEKEEVENALEDKKLAQEEIWIRKGIKARRVRNQGRVRALKELRENRQARREQAGSVRMNLEKGESSGMLVMEAKGVGFSYGEAEIIRNLTTTILRGDRIGIIGANGTGKTTLLRLLMRELQPDRGTLRYGARLEVAYYDQLRGQLMEDRTVKENVAGQGETITTNGRSRHILSYLRDFLFSPERALVPVKMLSGGERNRLLLAKLFARTANVFILDEPTNDLDAETLELLEEQLMNFDGTVLLVSHDRTFLNNVVTSTLVLDGEGGIREYAGGYDDWIRHQPPEVPKPKPKAKPKPKPKPKPRPSTRPKKLLRKEREELEALPGRIAGWESEQEKLTQEMGTAAFYRKDGAEISRVTNRLKEIESLLEGAYARWEELDERSSAK